MPDTVDLMLDTLFYLFEHKSDGQIVAALGSKELKDNETVRRVIFRWTAGSATRLEVLSVLNVEMSK